MTKNYKYSIIIPHYNNPELLERLLNSIPTDDDIQTIVIDDCSTEYLLELDNLKKNNSHVDWLSTGSNGGAGKARNIGLSHATGKYVLFADCDDFFLEGCRKIWDEATLNENLDLIYFNIKTCDSISSNPLIEERQILTKLYKKYKVKNILISKLKMMHTQPWAKIFKADYIKRNGFKFQESSVANDYLFSIETSYSTNNLDYCTTMFYCYTYNENSISDNPLHDNKKLYERIKVYDSVEKYCHTHNIKHYPYSAFIVSLISKHFSKHKIIKKYFEMNGKDWISELLYCSKRYISSYISSIKYEISSVITSDI